MLLNRSSSTTGESNRYIDLAESVERLKEEIRDLSEFIEAGTRLGEIDSIRDKIASEQIKRENQLKESLNEEIDKLNIGEFKEENDEELLGLLRRRNAGLWALVQKLRMNRKGCSQESTFSADDIACKIHEVLWQDETRVRRYVNSKRQSQRNLVKESLKKEIDVNTKDIEKINISLAAAGQQRRSVELSIGAENRKTHVWRYKTGSLKRTVGPFYDALDYVINPEHDPFRSYNVEGSAGLSMLRSSSSSSFTQMVRSMKTTSAVLSSENRLLLDKLHFTTKFKEGIEKKLNEMIRSLQKKYVGGGNKATPTTITNSKSTRKGSDNLQHAETSSTSASRKLLVPKYLPEYECSCDEVSLLEPFVGRRRAAAATSTSTTTNAQDEEEGIVKVAVNFLTFLTASNGRFADEFLGGLRNDDERPAAIALLTSETRALKESVRGTSELVNEMVEGRGRTKNSSVTDTLNLIQKQFMRKNCKRVTFWNIERDALTGEYLAWTTTLSDKISTKVPVKIITLSPLIGNLLEAVETSMMVEKSWIIREDFVVKSTSEISTCVPITAAGKGVTAVIEIITEDIEFDAEKPSDYISYSSTTEELFLWGYGKILLDLVQDLRQQVRNTWALNRRDILLKYLYVLSEGGGERCKSKRDLIVLLKTYLAELFQAEDVCLILVSKATLCRYRLIGGDVESSELLLSQNKDGTFIDYVPIGSSIKPGSVAEQTLWALKPIHIENPYGVGSLSGEAAQNNNGYHYNSAIDIPILHSDKKEDEGEHVTLHSWPFLSKKTQVNFIVQWYSFSSSPVEFGSSEDLSYQPSSSQTSMSSPSSSFKHCGSQSFLSIGKASSSPWGAGRTVQDGSSQGHAKIVENLLNIFSAELEKFFPLSMRTVRQANFSELQALAKSQLRMTVHNTLTDSTNEQTIRPPAGVYQLIGSAGNSSMLQRPDKRTNTSTPTSAMKRNSTDEISSSLSTPHSSRPSSPDEIHKETDELSVPKRSNKRPLTMKQIPVKQKHQFKSELERLAEMAKDPLVPCVSLVCDEDMSRASEVTNKNDDDVSSKHLHAVPLLPQNWKSTLHCSVSLPILTILHDPHKNQ